MNERRMEVHLDLAGRSVLAGRLFMRSRRARQSASFEYDRDWLVHPEAFSLDPALLPLGPGVFHTPTDRELFGGLADSAPDRWGRTLMRRQARRRGEARTLLEVDYLLMVHDEARQGALRLREGEAGPFQAAGPDPIPPLVRLRELLSAAERACLDQDVEADLRLLLAPGSSLGGARPKASIRDLDGSLAVAKFPAPQDEWPVIRWEAVTLDLARGAGIAVPRFRLEDVAGQPVLITSRFDRSGAARIPFLSAMAMLGATDREDDRSYLELADALRQHGVAVQANLAELWRRLVFNVLVSNTDDHLRNHGFLRSGAGWLLSPAYDLNPVPVDVKPRVHALALDLDDPTASMGTALDVAYYFGLDPDGARAIVTQVAESVSGWRQAAARRGLNRVQIERMASAFEHEDLKAALA